MANPITPSGRRRSSDYDRDDIASAARRQDEERRIREDNAYFERTGINRPPAGTYDPLVDNDRPDVAYDGDSYDDNPFNRHTASGEYAEDSPTRIIDSNSGDEETIRDAAIRRGLETSRETISVSDAAAIFRQISGDNASSIRASRAEREAHIQREKVKTDKEFLEKATKHRSKFKNAINGLELDEE
jgi:hypothetical protein